MWAAWCEFKTIRMHGDKCSPCPDAVVEPLLFSPAASLHSYHVPVYNPELLHDIL